MAYAASWTDGPRVVPAVTPVRDNHIIELGDAVNRRKLVCYQGATDFASHAVAGQLVHTSPLVMVESGLLNDVLMPPPGVLGGQPSSPTSMCWLWPDADGDENKVLVPAGAGTDQLNLLVKVLGNSTWADAVTNARTPIRALHINELRACLEKVTRGRWRMPLYMSAGLCNVPPADNQEWPGGYVATTPYAQEVRGLAFGELRGISDSIPYACGIAGVTVRPSSSLVISADTPCQVQVYRCLRHITYDLSGNMPTWNQYDPAGGGAWSTPGGIGSGDSVYIGTVTIPSSTLSGTLAGAGLATALQAMADGAEQNFLFRRADVAYGSIWLTHDLTVEFDLVSPPN